MRRKSPIEGRDWGELERFVKATRTEPSAPTRDDVRKKEREHLKSWGRPRRKMEGWPK